MSTATLTQKIWIPTDIWWQIKEYLFSNVYWKQVFTPTLLGIKQDIRTVSSVKMTYRLGYDRQRGSTDYDILFTERRSNSECISQMVRRSVTIDKFGCGLDFHYVEYNQDDISYYKSLRNPSENDYLWSDDDDDDYEDQWENFGRYDYDDDYDDKWHYGELYDSD